MKKRLSLLLAIAMVFSMFSSMAFAATNQSAGEYLKSIGVIKGDNSGNLNESDTWNRQDVTVILSRLLDAEADAAATAKGHTFADVSDPYYDGFITWAKAEGLFQGHSDIRFGYGDPITNKEFLTVMLRALGYDVAWEEVIEVAVELGLAEAGVDEEAHATRGALYNVVVQTLNTETADGVILGVALELPGFEEEVVEPETVEVADVYASNLKQVVVEFNQDVTDNAAAANKDNYTVKDGKVVDVDVDGDTATLTLDAAFSQQTTKVVTVSDKILEEKEEFEVRFFDTTVPESISAEVIGKNTIKVKFTEPLDVSDLTRTDKRAGFSLVDSDGKKIYVDDVTYANNNTEANVQFYTTFKEETYTLTVESSYKDYAGFKVLKAAYDVDVIVDEAGPELIGYKDAKPYSVTLIFNEDIQKNVTKDKFYHTNLNNPADAIEIDGNQVAVTFDPTDKMPSGTVYVYVKAEALKDLWDNKNIQQLRIAVEVVGDNDAPEIDKIEVVGQDKIKVTFNEDLDVTSAVDEDNYKLLNDKGDEIKNIIKDADVDGKVVTIEFNEEKSGDLTLVVEGVKDRYDNKMSKTSIDFFMEDVTPIKVPLANAKLFNRTGDIQTLVIDFGDKIAVEGDYSALDLSKYKVEGDSKALSGYKGISISATNNSEAVEIRIDTDAKDGLAAGIDTSKKIIVAIAKISDAAGNLQPVFGDATAEVTVDPVDYLSFGTAKAVADNKIEVKLNDTLEIFDEREFGLLVGGVTYDRNKFQIDEDSSGSVAVITFLLDDKLDAFGKLGGKDVEVTFRAATGGANSVNALGVALDDSEAPVLDGIKPSIKKIVLDATTNTIEVTVTENVYTNSNALAATDFIVTDDDGQLTAGVDYTVTVNGTDTITIDLNKVYTTGKRITVKTVASPKYIFDNASGGVTGDKESGDNLLAEKSGAERLTF